MEINAVENHPHELWQKQKFGVYHTSNGRRLPVHTGAILPPEEQEKRLKDIEGETGEYGVYKTNKPFSPVHDMVEGARSYNRNVGLSDPHEHGFDHVRTNPDILRSVGRAYQNLPNHDKSAEPHFQHMGHEIGQQFDHLTGRMGIKVHPVDYDPYKNVHEMVDDVRNNKRLKVLKTSVTGGHPYFSDDENDKFRAVHDAFGHAATGRGFDAHGEEAAFAAHSKMFSPHARPAMASETRGQNAFLHLNGDFGDQKVALLPQHMQNIAHDLRQHRSASLFMTAADWHEYRRLQDAQQRRYERAGVGGGQEEYDQYFGKGEHRGDGVEQRITPQDWMKWSRQPTFDDLPQHEQEWHRGHELGSAHGQDAANADFGAMDREHASSPHPEHFYNGYVEGLHSTGSRIAVRHSWAGPGRFPVARQIAEDMPTLVVLAHDSGDAEVVFHCPFCGSGQVLARNDGTIECQFCQACFTVQVQPQFPAFPQTINGMPVNVPGMGPQWPGEDPAAQEPGQPVPTDVDQDADGMPDDEEAPPGEGDEPGGGDENPFAKKSLLYRTDNGDWLDENQYLRHLALRHSGNKQLVLAQIREENGMGGS